MKRDWDLIRAILMAVEAEPAGRTVTASDVRTDATAHSVRFHIRLLNEAGLLVAAVDTDGGFDSPRYADIDRLTWEGYELLDAVRDDRAWQQVKATALSKGGGLTFEVLKALAVSLGKSALGLP
jgi:hypothetical protein